MCGIFGMFGHKEAGRLACLGLYALQHRGEESAGIVALHNRKLNYYKAMGLVCDVFDNKEVKSLRGDIAVGHVRYSTTGASIARNIQPFVAKHIKGHIVIAHNGNLVNAFSLRSAMEKRGSIFQTTMDSEIIAHLIAAFPDNNIEEALPPALARLEGAYSLVLMVNDTLIGCRDPQGFRPLCLGRLGNAFVLASETCAFDLIQAEYLRDIEPGEIVFINKHGLKSVKLPLEKKPAFCIFEYIYFARPDSNVFGKNVYLVRKSLGAELAREHPVECDLVMPVPDSGNYAALGYAQESKLPLEMGLIRNHYIGRTFIHPSQLVRDFRVKVKLNTIKDVLKGKRVVIVEDSIVRGTTSRVRVNTIRKAGAKEVHMRVSCPPIKFPCFYGIDFPTHKELIAYRHNLEQICKFIGLDSLKYLSLEGMLKSVFRSGADFCTGCFSGKYPVSVGKKILKNILECV